MTETKRASFEELLSFCQRVRKAGGGNPLSALMPAVPLSNSQCLIAKNLNFNCHVSTMSTDDPYWYMYVDDENLANRISEELGIDYIPYEDEYAIRLPLEIGQIAKDFDSWPRSYGYDYKEHIWYVDDEDKFKEFLPYIDAAYSEIAKIATINDKGELVL